MNRSTRKSLSLHDIFYLAIGLSSSIICILFSAFPMYKHENEEYLDGFNVVRSMNDLEFKYMLVIEMCVSVLVILEVVIDHFSRTSGFFSYKEFGIIAILASLFLSSGITFFYSIEAKNYHVLFSVWVARGEIMTVATIFVARNFDNSIWHSHVIMIAVIIFGISCVILVLRTNWSGSTGNLLLLLSFIILLYYNIKWYLHIWKCSKTRKISSNELNCTLICFVYACCVLAVWICFGSSGWPQTRDWNLNLIIQFEVIFTAYVVFVTAQQRRNIGREVAKYQSELEFKRMFVRYISHEVRTPLNTAIIGIEVLLEQVNQRNKDHLNILDQLETLGDIRCSCDIAVNVLNELLTFDKLEAGTLMVEKVDIPFMKFVQETVQPFQIQARKKEITLSVQNVCKNHVVVASSIVNGDRNKLAQILRNLVSNALKFTPVGGQVDVKVDVIRSDDGSDENMVKVDIVDSGAGVSKENQRKLFKEIVQFNPGTLQGGGGSGLGLYISYGIASLHDGSLSVFSEGEGHGCTFTLTLPVILSIVSPSSHSSPAVAYGSNSRTPVREFVSLQSPSSHQAVHLPFPRSPNSPFSDSSVIYLTTGNSSRVFERHHIHNNLENVRVITREEDDEKMDEQDLIPRPNGRLLEKMKQMKVLLVDDSDLSRKMLSRLLKTRFTNCREANNGKQAVKMAMDEDGPADIIIMDANMPVMSGLEATKKLRGKKFEGIIIGLTGNVTQEDLDAYLSSGADVVLTKPLAIRELETAIYALLGDEFLPFCGVRNKRDH